MTTAWILALIAGLVLGGRFKVLILAPAVAGAVAAVIAAGFARAEDSWSIVLASLGVALALQIGYLIASSLVYVHRVTREAVDLGRAPRPTL
jgi:predicted neutral ceramidase superfamily lipid hydrolase